MLFPLKLYLLSTYSVGFRYVAVASDVNTIAEKTFQVLDVADSSTQYVELGQSVAAHRSPCDGVAGHVMTGACA